jgi:hypothetical protein
MKRGPPRRFSMSTLTHSMAFLLLRGFRFGGGGGAGILLLVGLVFAGALVWALVGSNKTTA